MISLILKLTSSRIAKSSVDFDNLNENSFVLGAIDGNHISIIASKINPRSYYNCK